MRPAEASRALCGLVLVLAAGLALGHCGGTVAPSNAAAAGDAAARLPGDGEAGDGGDNGNANYPQPSEPINNCADPGCPVSRPPCTSNSDCGAGRLCDLSLAYAICVDCLTDDDCVDPDDKVCGSEGFCEACRTSVDCAQNGSGASCTRLGAFDPGIGICTCVTDADCSGRAGGPHCTAAGTCGCQSVAECTQSRYGLACVQETLGSTLRDCGCASDSDCPGAMTCARGGLCVEGTGLDAGTSPDAARGPDAGTGSVACAWSYSVPVSQGGSGGGGVGHGCNGAYASGSDYSITWTQPDGGLGVCDPSNPNALENCLAGTPCVFTEPVLIANGVPGGSAQGICQ